MTEEFYKSRAFFSKLCSEWQKIQWKL